MAAFERGPELKARLLAEYRSRRYAVPTERVAQTRGALALLSPSQRSALFAYHVAAVCDCRAELHHVQQLGVGGDNYWATVAEAHRAFWRVVDPDGRTAPVAPAAPPDATWQALGAAIERWPVSGPSSDGEDAGPKTATKL